MSLPNTTAQMNHDFINPVSMREMSDEQVDTMLVRIRAHRLEAYHKFMEAEKQRMEIRDEKLRTKLDKQCEMFNKELARVDKALSAIDKRIINIRTIQMQIGEL